ncbi:MAG: hypothetical protein WC783_00335 [Candidatus Paceibacterota bacterium]
MKDFFEERNIFGVPCYVAVDCESKSPWMYMDDEKYTEGLTDEDMSECGVFTWFKNHTENDVFEYYWS